MDSPCPPVALSLDPAADSQTSPSDRRRYRTFIYNYAHGYLLSFYTVTQKKTVASGNLELNINRY